MPRSVNEYSTVRYFAYICNQNFDKNIPKKMIGTITYILSRAGWRAMNGQLTDERRRLAGAEPPAAYVSYDPRLLAGAGWYGYRIAFKGGDRQMIERARYILSERYTIRDSYEYYADVSRYRKTFLPMPLPRCQNRWRTPRRSFRHEWLRS